MIAPDVNLLLYAYSPSSPHHQPSKHWLEDILSGAEPVGMPLTTIHSFVRLLTNFKVAGRHVSLEEAFAIVDEWLALPHVRILYPGQRHFELLRRIATDSKANANLFPDAAIAAIAAEYGAVVHSHDRDFARFRGVQWFDPLEI